MEDDEGKGEVLPLRERAEETLDPARLRADEEAAAERRRKHRKASRSAVNAIGGYATLWSGLWAWEDDEPI